MEHVLRVICVFEGGQPRKLVGRIRATHPCGAFVAERIDVLTSREGIESGSRTPRERDSPVVLGGGRPPARGAVFERGVPGGEGSGLFGHLRDRAARRLEGHVLGISARGLPPAVPQAPASLVRKRG